MGNNENLDLILSKKKALNIAEFQKVINDDMVASVENMKSDKQFHLLYEVKFFNSKTYRVYVKMSLDHIFRLMVSKNKI